MLPYSRQNVLKRGTLTEEDLISGVGVNKKGEAAASPKEVTLCPLF